MSMLDLAIVPPHLASSPLLMRMAVAFYITGISTSEFHRESPPLAGTLTGLGAAAILEWSPAFVNS
jgi:hypothetical protein